MIRVPAKVGIQVQVCERVRRLFFEKQQFCVMGGNLYLENSDFKNVDSRYYIYIAGGINHLAIQQQAQ